MPDIAQAYSIADLRRMAQRRLPLPVFDFFDGGAEDELTLRANRSAFEQVKLAPRVLVDVSAPDLSTPILGAKSALPFIVAPTGAAGIGWPEADIAIARAAAAVGIPYTLSTTATASIEAIAKRAGGRLWFQLYVLKDEKFLESLLARAEGAGFEGLVVTVDLAAGGKRERDARHRFHVPYRPGPAQVLGMLRHPAWLLRQLGHGLPQFENLRGLNGLDDTSLPIAMMVGQNLDAGFNWDKLERLRERWKGKLLVKGVERADDAARLAGMGVDAVWISNHGGRQLDGAMPTLQALPAVAAAVAGRVPVILDSGVRRGVDALKAIALGAQAVALGRATLFGAAVAGEAGARRALDILTDELTRAMQLAGTPGIADIRADLIA